MEINKKQKELLCEIAKQDGKRSISEVGKRVYCTNVTAYNNMELLRSMGFITLTRRKNKKIPWLTQKGLLYIENIYEVYKTVNGLTN